MNMGQKKWVAWLMMICLASTLVGTAFGEANGMAPSDFQILEPLMDLVAGAALVAHEDPQPVPGAEGTLSTEFVNAFFALGANGYSALGNVDGLLGDTQKQGEYLGKVFAAKAPELAVIPEQQAINGYIGFQPVTVNTAGEAGAIQIVGEVYWAPKKTSELTQEEFTQTQWLERAIFTFQGDKEAFNGFRLLGFSVGTELDMETAIQNYFEEILAEYVNATLGFWVQYPNVFTDDLLVEDGNGVSAALADGSASFFARRIENTGNSDLRNYVTEIAEGIPGAEYEVKEDFQYATMTYRDAEGRTVFDMFIVTDKYIYQSELSYLTQLTNQFHMYTTYLENTFMVEEVSVG